MDKRLKQLREAWKLLEQSEADFVEVDGKKRPIRNSLGELIHSTEEGVINFWRWFGSSKVVDREGRPLVVYHGGRKGIVKFDIEKAGSVRYSDWGSGIYFTPSYWQAERYMEESNKAADAESNALWDQMENLAREYGTSTGMADIDLNKGKISQEQYDSIKNLDRQWRKARGDASNSGEGEVYAVYLKIERPEIEVGMSTTDFGMSKRARESQKDGIIIQRENGSVDEIVAFASAQIKSIKNHGTFNSSSDNIYN